ncbi:MAG: molybdopterin-guanine dinucleotide biosynthesis protein B [Alphaproteobacteria bacterium]
MKIFGLAGWSGAGKTTLLVRLLPLFNARGLRVSTVKHAHERFDIDLPGKDSYEHRKAGAAEVLISSRQRWALIHEHREAREPELDQLLALLAPADLVLVEGFKRHAHDKLEVHQAGKPFLYPDDPHIVAIASDEPPPESGRPVFARSDVEAIARFILGRCGLDGR